jgi:ABC-type multidrug transport system ATPase subunit
VFQENAVETLLSTWDNLLIFGYLHGQSRAQASQRAREVAELLELGEHLPQRAHTLSGGFKRRLQVAKALMVETPVLFLDEATTGMDPLIKRRVMAALREQARSGRTILLTTQLLDEAEALCDRLVLLNEGRQVASGRLADLRGLSRKRLRIQLGFAHPSDEAVQALRAFEPKYLEERHGEVILEVDGTEDEWLRRMAGISRRWPLAHLQIQGASLEQIFLELFEHPSPRA